MCMCVRVCAQTAGRCWEWLCPPGSCAEKVQLGLSPANTPRHEAVGTARPRPRQPPSAGGVVSLRRCPPPAAPLQTLPTWPAAVWAGRCVRHWVRFLGSWLGVAERIYLLSGFGLPFLLCVTPQLVGCGPWAACSSRAVCTWLPGWGTSCGPPQGGAGKGGGGGTQKELPHHSRVEGRGLSLVSLTCLGPGSPKAYWSGWYVPGGSAECFVGDPRAAGRLTAPSQINERCTELLHSI